MTVDEETCDLSEASYDQHLSGVDFDKENQLFWASLDYFQYQKPLEMIEKVLTAHGYELNIENCLSCLDTFYISHFIKLKPGSLTSPVAQKFLPCGSFQLPSKSRKGLLLDLFYKEIEAFEKAKESVDDKKNKENEKNDIILKQKQTIDQLTQRVQHLEGLLKQQNIVSHVITEASELNHIEVREGLCHKIDWKSRTLTLKSGRQQFKVPFSSLSSLPKEGETCLIKTNKKKTAVHIVPLQSEARNFDYVLGEVISKDSDTLKVRIPHRGYWQIKALDTTEKKEIINAQRHMPILMVLVDDHIVQIQTLKTSHSNSKDFINEKWSTFEIIDHSEQLIDEEDHHGSS